MRSGFTGCWALKISRRTVRTRLQAQCTWNWNCHRKCRDGSLTRPPSEARQRKPEVNAVTNGAFMKKTASLLMLIGFSFSAFAATSKSVSYKSGDETVQGVLYTPEGKGPFPALLVIHEWWGINDWVKEQASKLADQGYMALAVDLYRGKVATSPDMAHELMRGVPDDRAARDLHAAVGFLKSQSNVKKDRIGSIGWCMGGGYSLNVALQEPTLAA